MRDAFISKIFVSNCYDCNDTKIERWRKETKFMIDWQELEPMESLIFNVSTTWSSTWIISLELLDYKSSMSQLPFVVVL